MKKEFFGFYDPTQEEIDAAWNKGAFVFDANALLNFYRYSESTRDDFLKTLNNLQDKLFMPYQVGFEFHSNRDSVIKGLSNLFDSIPKSIGDFFKEAGAFDNLFNGAKRHPSIDLEAFQKIKQKFVQSIQNELDKQKATHPDFSREDPILDQLTNLYDGKVGEPFSDDQLEKIFKEGENRFAKKIPPGYKDLETKKGNGNQRIYGDLIIWNELIEFAKVEKKPVVLITDDRKEDWWTREGGETTRPRHELIKEFYDLTGIRILIYSSDGFLKYAKNKGLIKEVTEESITEVREVRKDDESKGKEYIVFRNPGFQTIDPSAIPSIWGTSYEPIRQVSVLGNNQNFQYGLENPNFVGAFVTADSLISTGMRPNVINEWMVKRDSPVSIISSDMVRTSQPHSFYQTVINPDNLGVKVGDRFMTERPIHGPKVDEVLIPVSKKIEQEPKDKKKK